MAENNTPPEIPKRGIPKDPGTKGIPTKPGCNNDESKIDCKERIPVLSEIDDSDVIDFLEYLLRKVKGKQKVNAEDVLQFFKCDNYEDGDNDRCGAFRLDNARAIGRTGVSNDARIQQATIDLENARNDLLMIINKHEGEIERLNEENLPNEERISILQKLSNTFYNEKQRLETRIKGLSGQLNTPVKPLTGEDKRKASALARNILENLINLKDISVPPSEQGVTLGQLGNLPRGGGKRKRRNSQKKKKNKSNRKKRKSKASRKKRRN